MFPDYHGKLEGFYGLPIGQKYTERPFGMADFTERSCPTELPYWVPTWWRLVALVPPQRGGGKDPFVLYDRRTDTILHVWDREYPPSYVEVMQVCTQLHSQRKTNVQQR
jgi:hypothetical protein